MPPPTLLIVDDEPSMLEVLGRFAEEAGFAVVCLSDGAAALDYVAQHRVDIAAVDLHLPDFSGLEVLKALRAAGRDCQVILMSGAGTIDSAIEAIRLGAVDYLGKPIDFARFKRLLAAVREDAARRQRLFEAEHEVARSVEFCGMIGRAPVTQDLFDLVRRLAPHVRTALITGETGVGKELVARALFLSGPRSSKPFVTINCSAVVETLFESELFGHVRGAFTGATGDKPGLYETADGGTVFLDEVGELPPAVQAKLLRVLESGEVQRVGALRGRSVDVHVLAATNRDLRAEVEAGRFRSDLFYRLNAVELRVPPLRERRADIPYLTAAFVRESATRMNKRIVGVTPAAERAIVSARWDGNIRELRNVIERACILTDGEFISERELSSGVAETAPPPSAADTGVPAATADAAPLSSVERQHIIDVLERVGRNKSAAARMLGLTRWALYRRMASYHIDGLEALR